MKTLRRLAVASLILGLGGIAIDASAAQAHWPSRTIHLIVPFPAGSASDTLGRILGQRFGEIYGKSIVVENHPGAGGLIGSELVRQAPPDGYTYAMIGQPHISNALIRKKPPYNPLTDFTSVSLVATVPNVLVLGKGVNVKTIPQLIALAKAHPGKLNYGSAGVGSSSDLAAALFTTEAGIDVVQVPFRQGGDARAALLNGTVQFYVFPLPAIVGMIKSGKIRALAVASAKRAPTLPDVPTTAQAGFPKYRSDSWFGIVGPRGVPKAIVTRFNADIVRILKEPAIAHKFELEGATPAPDTPQAFAKMEHDQYVELAALVKKVGITLK